MQEVVERMAKLPCDTVCLLPTRHTCEKLNNWKLKNLPGKEVQLISVGTVDCPVYLCQKVSKKLGKYSKDSSLTAGLEKLVIIKLGCKIMLRWNIDISLGIVNGAIGIVTSIKYSIDEANIVDSITVNFDSGKEHMLEKVNSKFQILDKAFVIRRQFPISHAYVITIHKSQALALNNVLIDLGNSIFACGQAYVAMSRVTRLSGLILINFDPRSIKALDSAITEYSYLRKTYRPTLPSLCFHKHKPKSVQDRLWCTPKLTTLAQQQCADTETTILPRDGYVDPDGCSSYANSIMQCLLHSKVVRNVFRDGCVGELVKCYENNTSSALDCTDIRNHLGDVFAQPVARDPVDYLQTLSNYCPSLSSVLSHSVTIDTQCTLCNTTKTDNAEQLYIDMKVPQDCKSTDLKASAQQYQLQNSKLRESCGNPTKVRTYIVNTKQFV